MTTIACDGHWMAGDGRTESANEVIACNTANKVLRLSDGSLLGCAGVSAVKHLLAAWLEAGLAGEIKAFPKIAGSFSAMLLMPDGTGRYFYEDGKEHWTPIDFPFAIGSGSEVALGAMDAGKTPKEAIEIAAKRDPHTGGEIAVLSLRA